MLIGHINKHSPVEMLDAVDGAGPGSSSNMVWDRI
jgi:hypothetical protein